MFTHALRYANDGCLWLAFAALWAHRYYERRDLEAWRIVLENRGYTVVSQKQGADRPLVSFFDPV